MSTAALSSPCSAARPRTGRTEWRRGVEASRGRARLRRLPIDNGESIRPVVWLLEDPERSGYARMVRRCPNQQDSQQAALMPEATLVLE